MATPREAEQEMQQKVAGEMQNQLQTLTDVEKQQFFDWLTGKIPDPPPVVRGVIVNLASKINMVTGYLTSMNLIRMNRVAEFMQAAEEELFSTDRLQNMTTEEIASVYGEAQKVLSTSMDFARKFIYQNKDLGKNEEVDDLYKSLLSLPPERIRGLKKIIEEGK